MEKIVINTDGGARGNPGPAATGFVVKINGEIVGQKGRVIGSTTNNVAEYMAVIDALGWVAQYQKENKIIEPLHIDFYLDSNLVVNQLQGKFKIKQPHLMELATQIHLKLSQLQVKASYCYIPRKENAAADLLVNEALDAVARERSLESSKKIIHLFSEIKSRIKRILQDILNTWNRFINQTKFAE